MIRDGSGFAAYASEAVTVLSPIGRSVSIHAAHAAGVVGVSLWASVLARRQHELIGLDAEYSLGFGPEELEHCLEHAGYRCMQCISLYILVQ